jgi:hypothetical protein
MRVVQLRKVRVNLTIDEEIKTKAEELGLNLSKIAENALKEALRRLQGKDSLDRVDSSVSASSQEGLWRRRTDSKKLET